MDKVKLDIDCKERVAYDLMRVIIEKEHENAVTMDRSYILTLYSECLWATKVSKNPKDKA